MLPNKGGGSATVLPLQNLTSVVFKKLAADPMSHEGLWTAHLQTQITRELIRYMLTSRNQTHDIHAPKGGKMRAITIGLKSVIWFYATMNAPIRENWKKKQHFNWYRAFACPEFSSFYDIQLLKCAWQHIQGLWNALTKDWCSKRELCDLASVTVVIWPSSPPFISFYSASEFNHLRLLDSSVCYLSTVVLFVFHFPAT